MTARECAWECVNACEGEEAEVSMETMVDTCTAWIEKYAQERTRELRVALLATKTHCSECHGRGTVPVTGPNRIERIPCHLCEQVDMALSSGPAPGGSGEVCADCEKAARHAYSDATTSGFFHDKCEKHRTAPGGGEVEG